MQKLNAHEKRILVLSFFLVVLAGVLRSMSIHGIHPILFVWLRGLLQCGLMVAWGLSIWQRVLKGRIRTYLLAIDLLLLFWIAERTIKYMMLKEFADATRYCWYMYYIPIQLVPLFALFAALCIGHPESYKLPRKYNLMFIPAIAMIMIVMTNDLHQLVFTFQGGIPNRGDRYLYNVLYPVVMAWMGIEVLLFFIELFRKSRLPWKGRRLLLPFIPTLFGVVYGILYVLHNPILQEFAGDMNAVFALLIVLTCEACISTGLIPSNSRYKELFSASTLSARITDDDYNVILSSEPAGSTYGEDISDENMRKTENGPVMLSESIRLSGASITGGHVLWMEDVSKLTDVLRELTESKETLENSNILLEKNYRTAQSIRRLEEKNRLYDAMAMQTAPQIMRSGELLEEFRQADDEAVKRKLLGRLVIIGAYLKRRNNLIFISEQSDMISERELELCLEESFDNLKLYGVRCSFYIKTGGDVPADAAMKIYDFFEDVTEKAFEGLRSMMLRVFVKHEKYICCIDIDSDADLSAIGSAIKDVVYSRDEDEIDELTINIAHVIEETE